MLDAHRNNFHLLRLVLASLVMLSHGNYFFGLGYEWPLFHAAEWAVHGFFIISGLLISWSIDRRFEWRAYAVKRLARIYPLYALMIVLQLGVLLYFSGVAVNGQEIATYLAANLSTLNFLKPYLGDMVDFPFNGSLWTIKIEVMFYIALPFYVWFARRLGLAFVLASWLCAFAYRYMMDDISIQLARQLPGAMAYFIAGFMLYHYGPKLGLMRLIALACAGGLGCLALPVEFGDPLLHLLILMVLIYVCAFYVPALRLRYDISYGIYLIHAPFFVTLMHVKWLASSPQLAFALACACVIMLSFFAAIFVEEPAIKWGKKRAKRYETNRAEL